MLCPLDLALSLADQKMRGLMNLPESTCALTIVTGIEDSPLQENHRDLLWAAFGLPIFEELRGPCGRVIARECEVHQGLHVEDRSAFAPDVEMMREICDCGNEAPRLSGQLKMASYLIPSEPGPIGTRKISTSPTLSF